MRRYVTSRPIDEEPPRVVSLQVDENGDVDILVDGHLVAWFRQGHGLMVNKVGEAPHPVMTDDEISEVLLLGGGL